MNELPTSSTPNMPPDAPSQTDNLKAPAAYTALPNVFSAPLLKIILFAIAALILLLAAQWWYSRAEITNLRDELAQRLHSGERINTEIALLAKTLSESVRELQVKVLLLENKQAEAQNQQIALEQLYQDLSKNRDEWALAEIEQVLSTASAQLQLAGNVQGALIALQNADKSLARSEKPQFISIRRAIAKDIDKLKSLPSLDVTGIALKLDSVIAQIDALPLLSDAKPISPAVRPKNAMPVLTSGTEKNARARSEWLSAIEEGWRRWANEMWGELRQLIRIRSVETSDALLLSPTQAYYSRENLKLRLLNARLALLSRNESAFRSDMLAAQDAITKYFDTRAKQTQTVQTLLKQIQGSNLSIEMPHLGDSLNAVRNYKPKD